MPDLFTPGKIRGLTIKNRAVMPPMVCYGVKPENGFIGDNRITHYERAARGGVGLIIVESTCISPLGMTWDQQIGLWDDAFIPGLSRLTAACHAHGARIFIQLHHSAFKKPADARGVPAGASPDPEVPGSRELTLSEIEKLKCAHIQAALRAQKAGFDGVEVHGAHGFLLDRFVSPLSNRRTDSYGGSPENRLRLSCEVISGIRSACGNDFVIGYRLGGNIPTAAEGGEAAAVIERAGADVIHVTNSITSATREPVPWELPYNYTVYMASRVKKRVNVPIIAVNGIRTPEAASYLIENGLCDFTSIGRGLLSDPMLVSKAMKGLPFNRCIECPPKCCCFDDLEACPQRKKSLEAGV